MYQWEQHERSPNLFASSLLSRLTCFLFSDKFCCSLSLIHLLRRSTYEESEIIRNRSKPREASQHRSRKVDQKAKNYISVRSQHTNSLFCTGVVTQVPFTHTVNLPIFMLIIKLIKINLSIVVLNFPISSIHRLLFKS